MGETKKLIYLDNAATTKTAPEVVDAMLPYFTEMYGNPSSVYSFSQKSKEAITKARETIAGAIGAASNEIYFTAGGSEADNWAMEAAAEAYRAKGNHIITTKIEHHAILHTCEWLEKQGFEVTYLDVDENGTVKLSELKKAICPETILISVMLRTTRSVPFSRSLRSESWQRNMVSCSIPMRYRHLGRFRSRWMSCILICSVPVHIS